MWQIEVTGKVDEIYRLLHDQFEEDHVSVVHDDKVFHKAGINGVNRLGNRTYTEEGVSEQFRTIQKSWQSQMAQFSGKVEVTCGGEPGHSLWMKVEVL